MSVSEVSELETFAGIIVKFLTEQVFCPDGRKNSYRGNIPINLDAPFNMGEKVNMQCHPELVKRIPDNYDVPTALIDLSWMQLLSRLTFDVMWRDNIPIVVMHYHHEIYNMTYTAECQYSIQLKIMNSEVETTAYRRLHKLLHKLLHDIFETIMVGFINHLDSLDTQPECVCLAK